MIADTVRADQLQATVAGKVVQLGRPYRAQVPPLIGRERELELITAAWIRGRDRSPLSPLLVGEPGCGKNRIVQEVVRRTRKDLYIGQGHDDLTPEDLAISVRFSDDGEKEMDYVASPLATAMLLGGVFLFDEVAKARPRALALLASVLDERRYLDSILLGGRIHAHPAFRFIAATNSADLADSGMLPGFLRSRLRPVIEVAVADRSEIDEIVATRFVTAQQQLPRLLERFWFLWDKLTARNGHAVTAPAPRDVIHLFDLVLNLADYREFLATNGDARGEPLLESERTPVVRPEDLERAFMEVFHARI